MSQLGTVLVITMVVSLLLMVIGFVAYALDVIDRIVPSFAWLGLVIFIVSAGWFFGLPLAAYIIGWWA